jgi:hypothetical protein
LVTVPAAPPLALAPLAPPALALALVLPALAGLAEVEDELDELLHAAAASAVAASSTPVA